MIVPIKCMPKISAVGLFCLDKFENNQTRTCTTFFRTSKLTEVYFRLAPKRYLIIALMQGHIPVCIAHSYAPYPYPTTRRNVNFW